VLFGPAPVWSEPIFNRLLLSYEADGVLPLRLWPETQVTNGALDSTMKALSAKNGADYVSVLDAICSESGCLTRVGDSASEIITPDGDHFNPSAARYLIAKVAPEIFGASALQTPAQ
jgi:hypothetical protein